MKKVFIQLELGLPHDWMPQYLENVGKLGQYGFYWKIFTPNKYENVPDNVEIVPMTVDEFNSLCEKKVGINPHLFLTKTGVPSYHVTDYYIFSGVLFEDYLKDADFWGITNLDVVYGRLDHFTPDSYLEDCDIFTDDVNTINGVFSLWRNIPEVNNLYKEILDWQEVFTHLPCSACVNNDGSMHDFFACDEYHMTIVMNKPEVLKRIRYKYPKYYPMLSHDRLEQHQPKPKLVWKNDGSLWELFKDIESPEWMHKRPFIGKEVFYFHFCYTKKYPTINYDY